LLHVKDVDREEEEEQKVKHTEEGNSPEDADGGPQCRTCGIGGDFIPHEQRAPVAMSEEDMQNPPANTLYILFKCSAKAAAGQNRLASRIITQFASQGTKLQAPSQSKADLKVDDGFETARLKIASQEKFLRGDDNKVRAPDMTVYCVFQGSSEQVQELSAEIKANGSIAEDAKTALIVVSTAGFNKRHKGFETALAQLMQQIHVGDGTPRHKFIDLDVPQVKLNKTLNSVMGNFVEYALGVGGGCVIL
jgi:hypothetical protein